MSRFPESNERPSKRVETVKELLEVSMQMLTKSLVAGSRKSNQ